MNSRFIIRNVKWVLVIFVIWANSSFAAEDRTNSAVEFDIAEAVFRYQFVHNVSESNAAVCFLAFKGKDPDDAFLQRFMSLATLVKKKSEFKKQMDETTEKETGRSLFKFSISEIKKNSPNDAVVEGSCLEAGKRGSEDSYTVKLSGGKWIVIKDETNAIIKYVDFTDEVPHDLFKKKIKANDPNPTIPVRSGRLSVTQNEKVNL